MTTKRYSRAPKRCGLRLPKRQISISRAKDSPCRRYIHQRLARLRVLGGRSLAGRVESAAANLHGLCFLNGECEGIDLDLEEACELVQDLTGERGYCDSLRRILRSE